MATSNLELYEVLKRSMDEEAARMLAEALPPAGDVAMKSDVESAVVRLESGMNERFAQLETRMMRWILVFFVPLCVTIVGAVVTIALKG